jgi:hypothetical protein
MDNDIKQICKNIRSGRLLEENIPMLFNRLADSYFIYAGLQLAMNYYTFYEEYCDDEELWSKDAREIAAKINIFIRDNVLRFKSGPEHEASVCNVDSMRNVNMKRIDILAAYTDIFQIYEYVLNRIEYKYKDSSYTFDDEEFARDILRYIFSTEDNFTINEKIKDIIGQLPVRMTRQKYFDLLGQSIHAYKGADRDSLDTYLYMIKTSAMLHQVEDMDTYYPLLSEKKERLAQLQFKDLSLDEYNIAFNTLKSATLTLETETSLFIGLQEIINSLYILLLCYPYAGMSSSGLYKAWDCAIDIIGKVNKRFIEDKKEDISEEITVKLSEIEGIQEEISYQLTLLEDALYKVNLNHTKLTESLMLDQLMRVLLRSQKLNSNSMFIELDMLKSEEKVDETLIDKEITDLKEQIAIAFDGLDRIVCRAIIANTINKMPVFFSNRSEVMDYVRYTLEHCSDIYEKAASFEIINNIMSD